MIKKRVRGQDLAQNIGEEVIILGRVTAVITGGKAIELQTTDDVKVNITLPEPLDGNPEGCLEVWGVAKSKGTILANSYTHFLPEMTSDFSAATYNEYLQIANLLGDKKWRLSSDTSQLF